MKTWKRLAGALGAAAAVALAIGCSKSATGPSDPVVGSWRLTFAGKPAKTVNPIMTNCRRNPLIMLPPNRLLPYIGSSAYPQHSTPRAVGLSNE